MEKQNKKLEEWIEVKPKNEFYRWENKDQQVTGVLIESKAAGDYNTKQHSVETSPEQQITFWGSAQLDGLLDGLVGKKVRITLIETDYKYTRGKGKFFRVETGE
jgi:hypothetical protein